MSTSALCCSAPKLKNGSASTVIAESFRVKLHQLSTRVEPMRTDANQAPTATPIHQFMSSFPAAGLRDLRQVAPRDAKVGVVPEHALEHGGCAGGVPLRAQRAA